MIAALMHVSAAGLAQNININRKSVSVEAIIKELQIKTGYDFLYSDDLLLKTTKVDLNLKNGTLKNALDLLFKNQPLSFEVKSNTVVIYEKETIEPLARQWSELIDVKGKVTDDKGNPLRGATVSVVNLKRTAITDVNGDFLLTKIPESNPLEISFVGYQTRTLNATRDLGLIKLEVVIAGLDEVEIVNTGYQSLIRSRSPGTIEHIGQEVLASRPVTNLSAALDGIVAGMQAVESSNGNNSFIVRGISTLDRTNQRLPLIVIDGFPLTSTDFSTINPNDVESIDVLKDAAAAAVWGARATNGVIVITTKRGKGKQGLLIEGNAFLRVGGRPDLDQITTTASSAQAVAYERQAYANGFYSGTPYQGGIFPSELNRPLTLAQEILFNSRFRGLSDEAMNASLDSLSVINNRPDINRYLLQKTVTQQYNVALQNNTDRAKTYASLLFEHNKDRFVGNGYKKLAINFANEYKLADFITFNVSSFLQYNDASSNGVTLSELRTLSPYETLVNNDGSYSSATNTYNRYVLSQLPLSRFPYADLSYNLLRETRGRELRNENFYTRLQSGFIIKIIPGLTIDSKVQFERGKTDIGNYYSDDTFYVRQMVDNFTAYNNTTKTVGASLLPKGGINQTQFENIFNYNYRTQLNFIRDIRKFSVNATFGGEISQARTTGRINPWQYGYNPVTQTSVVPPYGYGSSLETFPASTITGGSTNILSGGNTTLSYNLDRFVSYFGAANVTYDKKYTLSLSIRGDASNYITSIPSLRWSPFWSIGGNWDVKAEKFISDIDWISYLHLRASYGSTGTANKSTSTEPLLLVGTAPSPITGTITANVASYGNPYLQWERTRTTNVGVDFNLFGRWLSGSLNLYNKSGRDITGTVNLPAVYGTTTETFNSADLINRGIEVQLGTSVKLPAGLIYSTSFNYAYNWNKITRLYYPNQFNYNLSIASAFVEGRPVNSFYTYNYAGVNSLGQPLIYGPSGTTSPISGSLLYVDSDGLTDGYMQYAGTRTSPHTIGWRQSLAYGSFSLTAIVTGTFGANILKPTFAYNTYIGSLKTVVSRFVEEPLQGGEDIIPFPSSADTGAGVSYWNFYTPYLSSNVLSASYIQLKELLLNYSLSNRILSKTKVINSNIFIQGRNLGMLWNNNRYNYNPDFLPGTDRPIPTYTIGVRFGF
jgi:TonB-linked SusC/RagA family outer membrane protein